MISSQDYISHQDVFEAPVTLTQEEDTVPVDPALWHQIKPYSATIVFFF